MDADTKFLLVKNDYQNGRCSKVDFLIARDEYEKATSQRIPFEAVVTNFTKTNVITIGIYSGSEDVVYLTQSSGSMRFQFNMTAAESRSMAEKLNAAADNLERG